MSLKTRLRSWNRQGSFKKLIWINVVALIAAIIPFNVDKISAANPNLIPNPSVEQVSSNPNLPVSWHTGNLWGDLDAKFSYEKTGQDGSRSLKAQITRYNTGDAKWYFDPITVKQNTKYIFSDYYTSNVISDVLAEITGTDGQTSWLWLGQNNPSSSWVKTNYEFISPANAAQLTIIHTIYSVGYLQTDNFNLAEKEIDNSLIPNGSLENPNPTNAKLPASWNKSSWGSNNVSFSYLSTGRTGKHSVMATMNYYTDGDAKWFYDPQPIEPGQTYIFSDYYKSNVTTRVVLWLTKTDGTSQYLSFANAPAASNWTKYTYRFVAPMGTTASSVMHLIDRKGTLTTDDYSLSLLPYTGFNEGVVSLTFDDGFADNYTNTIPLLKQYGYPSTQYLIGSMVNKAGYYTSNQIKSMASSGNEIGSHTMSHLDLTTLDNEHLNWELQWSQSTLGQMSGQKVSDFASPYGYYDSRVITNIQKYYTSHRTVDTGFNSKDDFNPYALKVENVTLTTTADEIKTWIDTAKTQKVYLVLVYHVINRSGTEYSNTPEQLKQHLDLIKNAGLKVMTVANALKTVKSQFGYLPDGYINHTALPVTGVSQASTPLTKNQDQPGLVGGKDSGQ